MKSKKIAIAFTVMIFCISFFSLVYSASAGTLNGIVHMTVNCSGVNFSGGGSVTYDRDTNGDNSETISLEARDGDGTVILSISDQRPLGSSATFSPLYTYTTPADHNPITARLISPAGNGLPEQVLLETVGTCAALSSVTVPTMTEWGMIIFMVLAGLGSVYYLGRHRRV